MDQEIAKRLMLQGATFVFLNVPTGTEFGIDMKSWTTGDNFKGVKMIPPGIHYIFYSGVDKTTGDTAPRIGFFYNFKPGEFVVRKWDLDQETISKEPVPNKDVNGLKQNITLLDNFLGPYPYDILEKWKSMTTHVTEKLCEKLIPLCGDIRSALELTSCYDCDRHRKSVDEASASTNGKKRWMSTKQLERQEEDLLPILKAKEGTEIRFSSFPSKAYPDDCTPSEITQHCLDSTFTLEKIIENYEK